MAFNFGDTTTFDREVLLEWFLHRLSWDGERQQIMREFPMIYNRLFPDHAPPVVSVVLTRLIGTGKENL